MTERITQRVQITRTKQFEFLVRFPDLPTEVTLVTDEAPPLGTGHGPNPAALLGAAVGNCLAASLVFCLQKRRAHVDRIDAEVAVRISRNERGRYRIDAIDVELAPGVPIDEADRLLLCEELYEDFCIVTESVRRGIPVNVSLRANEAAA